MIVAFTHVALHVRDLAACVAFYRDFCGLKVVHERGEPGDPRAVWLAQPGRERDFIFVLLPGGPGRDQAARISAISGSRWKAARPWTRSPPGQRLPVVLYQGALIKTHLTGFPCPLVRRGSRRGAVHHKRTTTQPAGKGNRPAVGLRGPPGALRPLPDAGASRREPRLPGRAATPHQMGLYQRSLVLSGRRARSPTRSAIIAACATLTAMRWSFPLASRWGRGRRI